jgi:uncharacterized membrane protein
MAQTDAARIWVFRDPVYSILLPIPVLCFFGALITDLIYTNSGGNLLWLDFSSWLLAAGLVFGAIAGLVLLIDLLRDQGLRRGFWNWAGFLLLIAALIVELINSFVHARDGWTAVVPGGFLLSILGSALILLSGWLWQSIRRRREGEAP